MKKTHVLLLFTFFYHVASAQINVTYATAYDNQLSQIVKKSNGNYLVVINEADTRQRPVVSNAKIFEMNSRGIFIDSVILQRKTQNTYIKHLVPLSDGYMGLGSITNKFDSQQFFWVFRLNRQFQLTQDTVVFVGNKTAGFAFAFDRDSNIIFSIGGLPKPYYFGKINTSGKIFSWKADSSEMVIPTNSLIVRKDSLLYTVFTDKEFITFDTAFNRIHKTPIVFAAGFNATLASLNDSTFIIGGRMSLPSTRVSLYGHFLGVATLSGRAVFRKVYESGSDTTIWGAINHSIDSTKQGEWYWGGTYNFIIAGDQHLPVESSFILHKLNRDFSTKWTKRYGGDAYYLMYGVLTTDDGGCLMYGTRYDYNSVPKYDAYMLKVNGEGLITSESSIPLSINNLHIYPNPSSGLVNFDYKEPLKDVQIRVIDTKGSLVHQVKIAEGLLPTLDLSFLNKGVYFIQIVEQNKIFSVSRWVKQR